MLLKRSEVTKDTSLVFKVRHAPFNRFTGISTMLMHHGTNMPQYGLRKIGGIVDIRIDAGIGIVHRGCA